MKSFSDSVSSLPSAVLGSSFTVEVEWTCKNHISSNCRRFFV